MRSKKKVLYIKRKQFLDWYLIEPEVRDSVIDLLKEKGKIEIQDLLDDIGFLPLSFIVNPERLDRKHLERARVEDNTLEEEELKHYELRFFPFEVDQLVTEPSILVGGLNLKVETRNLIHKQL